MNRIDTLSATLTVVVILSIGFFMYQGMESPTPLRMEGGVKKKQGVKVQETTKEAILADWTQERLPLRATPLRVTKEVAPVSPLRISTEREASRSIIMDPSQKTDKNSAQPPSLTDIHFHFDRSGLSQETQTRLASHIDVLQDPSWSVLVQGHTDQEGTIQQNLRVGLYRAKAVKKYLVDHGVLPEQIQVVSLGEFQPICTDNTPECQYQNRRVSFLLAPRDLAKEQSPMVNPSWQSRAPILSKDWQASEETTEVVSPNKILETQTSLPPEAALVEAPAVASFQPTPLDTPDPQPESKNGLMSVDPIIPEPVHSTPPPTMEFVDQNHHTTERE